MSEYKVQFEVFEGPLDLLLYLIKREEVDIYEVNLTKLATQFITHIDTMRLGILADALEETGCTDAEILTHLRSPGPHVKGCWVVDTLLDKN